MRNSIIKTLFLCTSLICYSQVGINTKDPNATLEIEASDAANPSNSDGILIPRVDKFPDNDPTAEKDSILIYLTTTIDNRTPGYYFWSHGRSKWCKLLTNVNMMLATKTGTSLDLVGNVFNYSSILYNDIHGATVNSSNHLKLPVGVYEVESNFRSSTGVYIEWNMRLNGSIYSSSIPGSSSTISVLGLGLSTSSPQKAILVINDENDYVDFVLTSGINLTITLVPSASYLKIKKVG